MHDDKWGKHGRWTLNAAAFWTNVPFALLIWVNASLTHPGKTRAVSDLRCKMCSFFVFFLRSVCFFFPQFDYGTSTEGHMKVYFQTEETFHLMLHLQMQLIHFVILMAIKAGDWPSERLCLPVTSQSLRKDHFIFLFDCAKRLETLLDVIQRAMNQSWLNHRFIIFSSHGKASWTRCASEKLKRTSWKFLQNGVNYQWLIQWRGSSGFWWTRGQSSQSALQVRLLIFGDRQNRLGMFDIIGW